jgi:hypothetical protein
MLYSLHSLTQQQQQQQKQQQQQQPMLHPPVKTLLEDTCARRGAKHYQDSSICARGAQKTSTITGLNATKSAADMKCLSGLRVAYDWKQQRIKACSVTT